MGSHPHLCNKKETFGSLKNGGGGGISLGFPPRSESFAFEPSVQAGSISSLSEFRFAQYVRKSAEPGQAPPVVGSSNTHMSQNKIGLGIKPIRFYGGGGGIRTHGTLACSTVFKTAPINRSGTPPRVFNWFTRQSYIKHIPL